MGDMQKRSDEVRTSFRLQPGYGMVHHRDKCVSLGLTEWFLLPQLTWKIEREDLLLTACSLGLLADKCVIETLRSPTLPGQSISLPHVHCASIGQVKALVEEQECPAHVTDKNNVSALTHACARGSVEIARSNVVCCLSINALSRFRYSRRVQQTLRPHRQILRSTDNTRRVTPFNLLERCCSLCSFVTAVVHPECSLTQLLLLHNCFSYPTASPTQLLYLPNCFSYPTASPTQQPCQQESGRAAGEARRVPRVPRPQRRDPSAPSRQAREPGDSVSVGARGGVRTRAEPQRVHASNGGSGKFTRDRGEFTRDRVEFTRDRDRDRVEFTRAPAGTWAKYRRAKRFGKLDPESAVKTLSSHLTTREFSSPANSSRTTVRRISNVDAQMLRCFIMSMLRCFIMSMLRCFIMSMLRCSDVLSCRCSDVLCASPPPCSAGAGMCGRGRELGARLPRGRRKAVRTWVREFNPVPGEFNPAPGEFNPVPGELNPVPGEFNGRHCETRLMD
eukprot:1183404-Prorocentrum_minimum.AAC.2